jgi:hypothetical protein
VILAKIASAPLGLKRHAIASDCVVTSSVMTVNPQSVQGPREVTMATSGHVATARH